MSTPTRNPNRPQMRGPGHMMGAAGMPAEKSLNFWPSAKRLIGQLAPEKIGATAVVLLTVAGVAFSVIGPKILGNATNIIFEGVIGKQLPAGVTKEQVVAALRAQGDDGQANLIEGMNVVPGQGIQFDQLARVLLFVLVLYVIASLAMWGQAFILNGVVQRTVLRLRTDVEDKLHRLPLKYFDTVPRGELLSRVTNDIDNIQQTMQQTLSQLLSSLLTLVGVLTMMVWISWQLALVALISVPLSMLVTAVIAKRSQPKFIEQWSQTGIFDEHGRLVEVQGVGRDITEQREAERALLASEERYRAVVEDLTELVGRYDADLKVTFANTAMARLTGRSPDELLGVDFFTGIPDHMKPGLRHRLLALDTDGIGMERQSEPRTRPG